MIPGNINRFGFTTVIIIVAAVLWLGPHAPVAAFEKMHSSVRERPSPQTVILENGARIHNILEMFIKYSEAGLNLDFNNRIILWDSMLEGACPDFFNQVIYRNKKGAAREKYKKAVINKFWNKIHPNMEILQRHNPSAIKRLDKVINSFIAHFPDFDPRNDYYLTVSFSFHGKVTDLEGKSVFALGLENFSPDSPELDITIAHELFHLYHFKRFNADGGLYRGIWAEGLAVYASEILVPGHELNSYFGFKQKRLIEICHVFERLKSNLLTDIGSGSYKIKRAYLGMEDNDLGIPPGAGYHIGEHLVHELYIDGYSLKEMAAWKPEIVFRHIKTTIPKLKRCMN